MSATRCVIHDADEPTLESDFIACLECGHVYRTASDLVLEDLVWQVEGRENGWGPKPRRRPAEEIESCPLCSHSF